MTYRTCSFPGCERLHNCHGLCRSHNMQRRRGKDLTPLAPLAVAPQISKPAKRNTPSATAPRTPRPKRDFWDYVDKTADCWRWQGRLDTGGYGTFRSGGKSIRAHRYVLTLTGARLGPGLVVDHLCRNKSCVNPEHLEQVTQAENMRRADMSGRRGVKPVRGPMRPDGSADHGSTGLYRNGCRCEVCRAAHAARIKDYRRRKAEQVAA